MKVTDLPLAGLKLIEPDVIGDNRGFFLETWHAERYREHGIDANFVQDNLSRSSKGVLRGLHFQNPHPQGKLVQCLEGEVFDVAVDIRKGSPTFGAWHGERLSAAEKKQFWIPRGFAHGYLVISNSALFYYKCDAKYRPEYEHSIQWNDPGLNIRWPTGLNQKPCVSPKDQAAPCIADLGGAKLFDSVFRDTVGKT